MKRCQSYIDIFEKEAEEEHRLLYGQSILRRLEAEARQLQSEEAARRRQREYAKKYADQLRKQKDCSLS